MYRKFLKPCAVCQGVLGKSISGVKFSNRLIAYPAVVSGFLPASLRRMMRATMRHSDALDEDESEGTCV